MCIIFLIHIIQKNTKMKIINISQKTSCLVIFAGIILFGSGCSKLAGFTKENTTPTSCADRAIDRAFNLHNGAKTGLALYFDERSDNQLYQAFYAAADSVYESRKIKKCWDRKVSHYNAMQNLKEMNTALARVIRRNMPDDDRGELISVFREQFDWVMPNFR